MNLKEWMKIAHPYFEGAFSMWGDMPDGAYFQAMVDSVEWHLENVSEEMQACGIPPPPTKDPHEIVMAYLRHK